MEALALAYASVALYALALSLAYNPHWVAAMAISALSFSLVSVLVAYRRLYYLAAGSPHASLLSVSAAFAIANALAPGLEIPLAIAMGLAMIYIVGYMIHRGFDPDIATSVLVGSTASLGILASYYALTRFPASYSLSSIMLGDPLLVGESEFLAVLATALLTLSIFVLTYYEQASLGVDATSARLAGIRAWVYDLAAYTLIGVNVVVLMRIVGYVMEHVMLLMPPSIAFAVSKSYRGAVHASILSSLSCSLAGLHLALVFNVSPVGAAGALLLIGYLISLWARRRGG